MANVLSLEAVTLDLIVRGLRRLIEQGADFNRTRWELRWNERATLADNLASCLAEENALQQLASDGVITIDVQPEKLDKFGYLDPRDFMIAENLYSHAGFMLQNDPYAYNCAYGRAIWITSLNREKLDKYSVTSVEVTLDLVGTQPVVVVGGTVYKFGSMHHNSIAFQVIEYCLNKRPGKLVTLIELKQELHIEGARNLTQAFRRTLFERSGPLSMFAKTMPNTIRVMPVVTINQEALELIKSASKTPKVGVAPSAL